MIRLLLFLLCCLFGSHSLDAQPFAAVEQVNSLPGAFPPPRAVNTLPPAQQVGGGSNANLSPQNIIADSGGGMNVTPSWTAQTLAIVFVALLPYFVILLTAFIKIVVVLSLLRNAIGVQQSPPNQVINGLALILSVYVMFPTGLAMYNETKHLLDARASQTELLSKESAVLLIQGINVAKEPLRDFLVRNSNASQLKSFHSLALKSLPEQFRQDTKPTDFLVLVPAYITSQLKDAYEIGVLIYLPFFIVDLVTSNILLAMGMMMLSPLTIALPLKLLLLVMVDGWTLLIQGLVLSFK